MPAAPSATLRCADDRPAATPAITALEAPGIPFRVVRTEIARSAEESASFQGIPVGSLLRSILVRGRPRLLFVLVPGGRRFDWPKLRAHLGTNRLSLPDAAEAKEITGYERGAITPFGGAAGLAGDRGCIGRRPRCRRDRWRGRGCESPTWHPADLSSPRPARGR